MSNENIIEIINNNYLIEIDNPQYNLLVDNTINIDYTYSENKPKINGVVLIGNKTSSDLSLASSGEILLKENLANKVTALSANSTDIQYPSAKCVYDNLVLKADSSLSNLSNSGESHFDNKFLNLAGGTVSGALTVTGTVCANSGAIITGNINHSGILDLQPPSETDNWGGIIDFHYNRSSADYTSRIAELSSGVISFACTRVKGSAIASVCLPSSSYTNLTLGANGTTYTAPANGWVCWTASATGNYIYLRNNTKAVRSGGTGNCQWALDMTIPVCKGDVFTTLYSGTAHNELLRFTYAQGEV